MDRRHFLSQVGLGSLAGYSLVVLAGDEPSATAAEGRSVEAIRKELERVAPKGERRAAPNEPHMTLVKLDCEGAEWPILLTSRRLGRIEAFCGEYHLGPLPGLYRVPGFAAYGVEVLLRCLREQGFRALVRPQGNKPFVTGLFFAARTAL